MVQLPPMKTLPNVSIKLTCWTWWRSYVELLDHPDNKVLLSLPSSTGCTPIGSLFSIMFRIPISAEGA